MREAVGLEHRADQLVVEAQHLVEDLRVLDVVALLVALELLGVGHDLVLSDVLKRNQVVLVLVGTPSCWVLGSEEAPLRGRCCFVEGGGGVLGGSGERLVLFEVTQLAEHFR